MNILIFSSIFLTVFLLLNIYIYKRLIKKLDVKHKIKKILSLFLIVNYFGIVGYMFTRYFVDVPNWLYFLLSIPIGILFLLFCTTLLYEILRFTLSKIPMTHQRRNFFKRSLDITALTSSTLLSAKAMYNAQIVQLEHVDIKIKKLAKPYKIAQLSDIHIGGLIDTEFIKNIITRVNKLKPDLVVITGDLVDIEVSRAEKTLQEFTKLQSKYGTYYIVGNHEYFHGLEGIIQTVKSLGIKVLENENVYIGEKNQGFNLVGVYDIFGYRVKNHMPDIDKALNALKDSPTILLAHQPKFIEEVKSNVDLMLSGHTHGGQIYPFKFLIALQQPYIKGLHQHNKNLQIYINKGTGFWGPPMRLEASAEITEIVIS